MKHYKSVEILSIFGASSLPAKTQSPLLKTSWRRLCTVVQYCITFMWKSH